MRLGNLQSESDNDERKSPILSETENLRLSPNSNQLVQRNRRLSVDNISVSSANMNNKSELNNRKNSAIKKSNILPNIGNKFVINNNQMNDSRKLQVPNSARKNSVSIQPLPLPLRNKGRRLSLQPQDLMAVDTSKRKLSVIADTHARRASRVISKFEHNLIKKEIALTGKQEEEDPLKELRACRYLRHNYKVEDSELCPCLTCERGKTCDAGKSTNIKN